MAALLVCAQVLTLLTFSSAYPFYDQQRWTPDEIASYLYQRQISQRPSPVENMAFDTDNQGLGQVSAVDVNSDSQLFVFHRGDRPWNASTFHPLINTLTDAARVPISTDTIFKLDSDTGKLISSFGGNFFNVPHGLKFDSNDNLWLTDVGRHQVFRFPKDATSPDLTLGEKFVPGDDDEHFCKPTDVAVASNGDFFVADGYCNDRVLKFSKDGKVIAKWGTKTNSNGDLTPFSLSIPHSITLVEELDIVCVADRENSRALCYNAGLTPDSTAGTFNRTLIPAGDEGKVYAIYYNKADQEIIAAAALADQPIPQNGEYFFPARAFTYGLDGQEREAWAYITPEAAKNGPSLIHDLCTSRDGQDYFLADLDQYRVLKYSKGPEAVLG